MQVLTPNTGLDVASLSTFLARSSLATTVSVSPADGTPLSPLMTTGIAGLAEVTASLAGVRMLLTLPQLHPTTTASPTLSLPRVTSTVARAPMPTSLWLWRNK